jgi:hypothetical protein
MKNINMIASIAIVVIGLGTVGYVFVASKASALPGSQSASVVHTNTPCGITAFTATPTSVPIAGSTSLSWNTIGDCTNVTLDGAPVSSDISDKMSGPLFSSHAYLLFASDAAGNKQAWPITVTVEGQ